MYIKSVKIKNFRNYAEASAEFSPGLNILAGKNAQGKTNLVEAVYLACVGKSPRAGKDRELINYDSPDAYISVIGQKNAGRERVEVYLTRTDNKRISINSTPIARLGELLGTLNAVFFSPEELKIVKEGPSERRRFLDIDISQLSRRYFYTLNRYNKILAQRNRLLKTGRALAETLPVWNGQLADAGAEIAFERREFVLALAPHAAAAHEYLTGGAESLSMEYEGIEGNTPEEMHAAFMAALAANYNRDVDNGYTNYGPHKDDVRLTVAGKDIRVYGSQGQQRTAALSIKLAELEIFRAQCGEYPILILDDVLSELDSERKALLLSRTEGIQTLLTGTTIPETTGERKIFLIEKGQITEH